MINYLKFFN